MVGETILHYRILKKLGSGGMGVVYEAEDTTLGRKVALKFLPEQTAKDASMLARLQREARAASALNHPNICTIYAVEQSEAHFFISMELLEGMALDHLIAEKALGNEQIIELGLQMCDALEAAHSKGIIHRDIKPANIFVTHQNRVKILDFGLAKIEDMLAAGAADSERTRAASDLGLTHPGTTMGTIAYMSPEQARGEPIDARTDIFSLGVVLYQMATGKVPFEGNTSAIVFARLLEHAPVSPVRLNPGLPSQLEGIINKTLEKDRNLRYQTAADVAADLRRLKRDSGSRQTVSVAVQTAKPAAKSNRGVFVAVGAVALIALLAGGLYWVKARRAANAIPARTLAISPLVNVGDPNNAYLSDGITKEIAAKLGQLSDLHVESTPVAKDGAQPASGSVLSGSLVRSGDAVVVNTDLADAVTHQSLWNHQYTANTSELQALEGQIASDIAEHAGVRVGWEERRLLQAVKTPSPEAYLLYLEARYDLDRKTPADASKAADLLNQALQKDANFTAASEALAEAQKQSPQAAPAVDTNAELTEPVKATPSQKSSDRQKRSSVKTAAVTPAPVPAPPVAPATPAPEPAMGKISIQSQPAGASIVLDGKDTGKKTPAQIEAARGAHSIVLKQAGYLDASTSANINASGDSVTISQALAKAGETQEIKTIGGLKKIFGSPEEQMGRVRVETNPKGARVTVGTQAVPKPTPVEFALNPGAYQIKVEMDGYQSIEKTIDVTAGKKVQLKETLTKK